MAIDQHPWSVGYVSNRDSLLSQATQVTLDQARWFANKLYNRLKFESNTHKTFSTPWVDWWRIVHDGDSILVWEKQVSEYRSSGCFIRGWPKSSKVSIFFRKRNCVFIFQQSLLCSPFFTFSFSPSLSRAYVCVCSLHSFTIIQTFPSFIFKF